MPVVPASNSYTLGIHKQTNESTVGTVADYSMPVYSAEVGPTEDLRRIEVTDAASIQGDPYKGPQSWTAAFEMPAFGSSLGRLLQALWPTDTISGAGPYTHTYSGLGGTQSWISMYTNWVNAGTFSQTFGAGLCSGMTFTSTAEGGPLRIGFNAIGQAASVAAFTVTNAETLALGYFQLQATGAKIELDVDTPDVNPSSQPEKVRNVTIGIERAVGPEPVADAFAVLVRCLPRYLLRSRGRYERIAHAGLRCHRVDLEALGSVHLGVPSLHPAGRVPLRHPCARPRWRGHRATHHPGDREACQRRSCSAGALELDHAGLLMATTTLVMWNPTVVTLPIAAAHAAASAEAAKVAQGLAPGRIRVSAHPASSEIVNLTATGPGAVPQEYGAGPHEISPRVKVVMASKKFGPVSGTVHHPGNPALHYTGRGAQTYRAAFIAAAKRLFH
jgi:hypothetical protein